MTARVRASSNTAAVSVAAAAAATLDVADAADAADAERQPQRELETPRAVLTPGEVPPALEADLQPAPGPLGRRTQLAPALRQPQGPSGRPAAQECLLKGRQQMGECRLRHRDLRLSERPRGRQSLQLHRAAACRPGAPRQAAGARPRLSWGRSSPCGPPLKSRRRPAALRRDPLQRLARLERHRGPWALGGCRHSMVQPLQPRPKPHCWCPG